jgi:hypothetical protein
MYKLKMEVNKEKKNYNNSFYKNLVNNHLPIKLLLNNSIQYQNFRKFDFVKKIALLKFTLSNLNQSLFLKSIVNF